MPGNAKYENMDLLESVILPMANLRFTLEDILRNRELIDPQELLRGLQIVHKNAAAIHDQLTISRAPELFEQPERRTLTVLQDFDAPIIDATKQLEIAR